MAMYRMAPAQRSMSLTITMYVNKVRITIHYLSIPKYLNKSAIFVLDGMRDRMMNNM